MSEPVEDARGEPRDPDAELIGMDADATAESAVSGTAPQIEDLADDDLDAAARAIDHDLIRRAQVGEETAFQSLVERHQQRAWRVARNMVASDEDAQDLAQEAFVRVFKNLANFDFKHGFTTWLYRIVTNLAIDHLRKRRPSMSTTRVDDDEGEIELVDVRAQSPSHNLERLELADQVKACLESLAPHFQSVLVLREVEGLPCSEIADIVGATNVTVRWRLHRGRKLFQEEWERRMRLVDSGVDAATRTSFGANQSRDHNVEADNETEPD